jgi:hypothetical protein
MYKHSHGTDLPASPANDTLAHACRWIALIGSLALCTWSIAQSLS